MGYPNNVIDDLTPTTSDSSVIRPEDSNQEFGLPAGYAARAKSLDLQQSSAESNAMDYLHQAMRKSAEVSPTQGIAAALLAAIPTLGGYLIGKSVGQPNIPKGVYGLNLDKYQSGAAAGGLEGSLVGDKSSKNYLDSLDANQAQKNAINVQMAAIQKGKADRLQGNEESIIQAGLGQKANADSQARAQNFEREMLPKRDDAELKKQEDYYDYQLQHPKADSTKRDLTPDEKTFYSDKLKVPSNLINTTADVDRIRLASKGSGGASGGAISEKTAIDLGAPIALATDIKQSIRDLQKALGDDPSLLSKGISALPLGSPAYNAMKQLQIAGAQGAKLKEGRVNDTTLKLYSDLLTSLDTEPLSAVVQRAGRFNDSLYNDVSEKVNMIKVGSKKDTSGIEDALSKIHGGGQSSGGMPNRNGFSTPQEYLSALKAYNAGQ